MGSAEDVFCCHNDFIRDTANAAHLQLTAHEWCQFFGRETFRGPHLWDHGGIPTVLGESLGGPPRQSDLLGQMSPDELGKFRSTWCTKRYDHDHDLCEFAHIEINDGWLRRNPVTSSYKNEMCNFISIAGDKMISPTQLYLNEDPKGVDLVTSVRMCIPQILIGPSRHHLMAALLPETEGKKNLIMESLSPGLGFLPLW